MINLIILTEIKANEARASYPCIWKESINSVPALALRRKNRDVTITTFVQSSAGVLFANGRTYRAEDCISSPISFADWNSFSVWQESPGLSPLTALKEAMSFNIGIIKWQLRQLCHGNEMSVGHISVVQSETLSLILFAVIWLPYLRFTHNWIRYTLKQNLRDSKGIWKLTKVEASNFFTDKVWIH